MNGVASPASLALLFPYVTSALFLATIAIVAGRKLRLRTVRFFVLVVWMEFAWTVLLMAELIAPSLGGKTFWDNLRFPVSLAAGTSLFIFACRIIDWPRGTRFRALLLLYIPALASGILAFADPSGSLLRIAPAIEGPLPFGELVYGYTLIDYILFAFTYGLSLVAIGMLLASSAGAPAPDKRKYRLVILGFSIPLVGIIPALLDVRILGHRDIFPIWSAVGSLPFFIAFFRFRLFDIMPIARRVVVESLGDPIFAFDADGLLLDCNRAFAKLLGTSIHHLVGRRLQDVLLAWPPIERLALEGAAGVGTGKANGEDVTVSDPCGYRRYRVAVSSIPGEDGDPGDELCKVAVFRDVSELAAVEKQLLAWNAELEGRIASRIRDLEEEVARRRAAEEGLRRVSTRIVGSQHEILVTLSEVVENRSPETANHVLRVGEYSRILAMAYGLSPEGVALIVDAAPLHDVGKIAVPDSILNKPGALAVEEMTTMKTHTIVGYRILGSSERSIIRAAAVIALEHHERWNGEGYPAGKRGDEISLSGRIVCICDVFDALATSRPYKKPWDIGRILDFYHEESGRMFDPDLTKLFFANLDRFREVSARYPDVVPEV